MAVIYVPGPLSGQQYAVNIAGDAPTPAEQARIDQYISQQEAAFQSQYESMFGSVGAEQQPAPEDTTAFGRGIDQGVASLMRAYGSAVEGVGRTTGIETLQQYGADVAARRSEELERLAEAAALEKEREAQGIVGGAATYVGEIAGQSAPQTAVSLAGGIAGAKAGAAVGAFGGPVGAAVGSVIGGLGGAALASLPYFYGDYREQQKEADVEAGRPVEVSEGAAALAAVPASVLDGVLSAVGAKYGANVLKNAAKGGLFTRAARGAAGGVAVEVPTEIGQELLGIVQAGEDPLSDNAIKRYGEAALGAAVLGGGIGAVGGAAVTGRKAEEERKKRELDEDMEELAARGEQYIQNARQSRSKEVAERVVSPQPDLPMLPSPVEPARTTPQEETSLRGRAGMEAITPTRPVLLTDLPLEERVAISRARESAGREASPETTLDEIQAVVGTAASDREAKKQKPITGGVARFGPVENKTFTQEQYDRAVQQVKADKGVSFPKIQKAIRDVTKKTVPNTVVRDIRDEMVRRGVVRADTKSRTGYTLEPVAKTETIETSLRREIDTLNKEIDRSQKDRTNLVEEVRRVEQTGKDSAGKKASSADYNQRLDTLDASIGAAKARVAAAEVEIKNAKDAGRIPSVEAAALESTKVRAPVEAGTVESVQQRMDAIKQSISAYDQQISDAEKAAANLRKQQKKVQLNNAQKEQLQQYETTIANLRKIRETAAARIKNPSAVVQAEKERQNAAQARYNSALITEPTNYTPSFDAQQQKVFGALRKRLDNLGLKDVRLEGSQVMLARDQSGKPIGVAEGKYNPTKKIISLSMGIYKPGMSNQELFDSISGVMNHEVIHALRLMNVFKEKEWNALTNYARSRKYVAIKQGKPTERSYTYAERARAMGYDDGVIDEESVAELFRDYLDGKTTVKGPQRKFFERLKAFFKSLIGVHVDSGFDSPEKIFEDIRFGRIGARERAPVEEPVVRESRAAAQQATMDPDFMKWASEPEGKRVVTDDRGAPVVYYTGTSKDKDFAEFNVRRHGGWFTTNPDEASSYALENDSMGFQRDGWNIIKTNTASRVIPAFIRVANPYRGPKPESVMLKDNYKKAQTEWFDTLRAQGYDSWMPKDAPGLLVVLGDPQQVKSVFARGGVGKKTMSRFSNVPISPRLKALSVIDRIDSDGNFRDVAPRNKKGKRIANVNKEDAVRMLQADRGNFVFDLNDPNSADDIATIMAAEAETALAGDTSALGWYDRLVSLSKRVVSILHPEILVDIDAAHAFDYATAVTSNGLSVKDNYILANKQYENWKKTGYFIEGSEGTSGKQGASMESAFKAYNDMKRPVERGGLGMTDSEIIDFLSSRMTVGDLRKNEVVQRLGINVDAKEKAGTVINGSYIIGPKIGQGFYQNLRGNFDQLTMDRWWMRFFNRITGNPFKTYGENTINNGINRLRDTMVDPSDVPMILQAMKNIDADILTDEVVGQLSIEIDKLYQRAYAAAPKGDKPVKTNVFLAANALRPKIEGELEESPRNATDRDFMRTVTRLAVDKLAKATNVRLDMADFQALMWYWEKRLWRSLGIRQGRGEDNDYVDGAIELLRKQGVPDSEILQALPDSERQRIDTGPDTGRDEDEVPSGVGGRLEEKDRIAAEGRDASQRGNSPIDRRYSVVPGRGVGGLGTREAAGRSLAEPEQGLALPPLEPLPGAPRVEGFTGPDPNLVRVAEGYAKSIGLNLRRQSEYVDVDPDRAARIAAAYDAMPHAPQDPKVKEAYQNLIRQTLAQYSALANDGYRFWFTDLSRADNEEYLSSPWNAMRDIRANKRMGVFPTLEGFGSGATELNVEDNPMLEDTGLRWPVGSPDSEQKAPVLANDLFRAVHDAFGHGLEGSGFRARGEENAWQAHVRLFNGSAVGAITSETRGQNSWLNYGPYGDANRSAKVEDTVFADQKTGLMPSWTWEEGRAGDMPQETPAASNPPTQLLRRSMVPVRNSVAANAQRQTARKQTGVIYSKAADVIAAGLKLRGYGVEEQKAKRIADDIVKKFQDGMIPVGRMIDELRANGLNITDAMDTYMQEELYHGVVGERVEQAQTNMYRPLIDLVGKLNVTDQAKQQLISVSNGAAAGRGFASYAFDDTRSNALSMADIYLYASHAKERNEYIRSIDPENESGSGMSDAEADAILSWFSNSSYANTVNQIRDAAQKIVKYTNEVRLDGGLIPKDFFEVTDPETGETIEVPQYDNYVPLRGKRDPSGELVDEQATGPYRSPMYGARRREDRRSLGRYDYADNIIPNLLVQNQNAIVRAERNKVGQSFLKLLRSDPSKTKAYGRILTPGDMRPVQRRVLIERKRKDGTTVQKVQTILDPNFRQEPDIFVVKEEGKEVIVKLENDAIASALKGDISATHSNKMVRVLSTINRYLASINTSLNPAFFITNMFRDLQTAGVNVAQYEIDGLTTKIVKDLPSSLRGIKQSIRNGDNSSQWAQIYRDFVKNGGQNSLNQVNTVADQMANISGIIGDIADSGIRKQFNRVKNGFVGKGAMSLINFVEDYNSVIENGIRVSTYKALLDRGFTPQRAAQAARNITVNFSKGGDYKTFMNAMFLFYNASLQGSFAMLNAALRSRRVQMFWASAIGVGLMQDYMNAMLSDEDDDGVKLYDKIPQYVLEHNLILPDPFGFTDRSYISIPMPYGLNMAHNLGRSMGRLSRGAYDPGEAAGSIVGTALNVINPIGGTESFANFASPTIADPFVDIMQNENFAGQPVYKEGFPGDRTPSSQLYWSTTSTPAVWLANTMNSLTGGTTEVKGLVDVSPDLIDFWFEYLTGGVGRFVLRTAETPFMAYDQGFSEDVVRNLPIFGKIIGTITTREDTGEYIEKRNQVLTALDEVKAAVEEGNMERLAAARERFSDEIKVSGAVRAIDNARMKLSRQMRQVKESRMPEEQKRIILERLDDRMQQLTARANKIMRDL